jgi:hypothetical protein
MRWLGLAVPVALMFWAWRVLRRPTKPYEYMSPLWTRGARYERQGYDR